MDKISDIWRSMEAKVLTGAEIDFTKLSTLMLSAFLAENQSNLERTEKLKSLSPIALERKYSTGTKLGKLAVIVKDNDYIACNGMLHIQIIQNSKMTEGWMSCDTATRPDYRGRGLFKECIAALRNHLPDQGIFFGFPNKVSRKLFEKQSWELKVDYPLYLSLVFPTKSKGKSIFVSEFKENIYRLAYQNGINKTPPYLNWRYDDSKATYLRFVSNDYDYIIVLREIKIKKIKFMFLMDLIAYDEKSYISAINEINRISFSRNCRFLVLTMSPVSKEFLKNWHTIRIPRSFQPKEITLMGQALGVDSKVAWNSDWDLSLGDWDTL
jgi:GNAT superfamily N-acetyltransferase